MKTRTVHDPFSGVDVQISDRLVDRLRGKYASGPHLPNGNPEFGWRQFQAPPIQHEAADRIEALEAALRGIVNNWYEFGEMMVKNQTVYGLDERIDDADRLLRQATVKAA